MGNQGTPPPKSRGTNLSTKLKIGITGGAMKVTPIMSLDLLAGLVQVGGRVQGSVTDAGIHNEGVAAGQAVIAVVVI